MLNNGYFPAGFGQYQTGGIPAPAQIKNIMPPQGGYQQAAPVPVSDGLGLCQVNGFQMVQSFRDAAGCDWVSIPVMCRLLIFGITLCRALTTRYIYTW